jgi:hypothetical protein
MAFLNHPSNLKIHGEVPASQRALGQLVLVLGKNHGHGHGHGQAHGHGVFILATYPTGK